MSAIRPGTALRDDARGSLPRDMAKHWANTFPSDDKAMKTGTALVTKVLSPQTCGDDVSEAEQTTTSRGLPYPLEESRGNDDFGVRQFALGQCRELDRAGSVEVPAHPREVQNPHRQCWPGCTGRSQSRLRKAPRASASWARLAPRSTPTRRGSAVERVGGPRA